MEPLSVVLAVALAQGLTEVGKKIVDQGIIDPALAPFLDQLKSWVQKPFTRAQHDKGLQAAVAAALDAAGAPEDEDALLRWATQMSLHKLQANKNPALRRQLARAALTFTDAAADPPEDLRLALGWPRSQADRLSRLLAALHQQLGELADWKAPLELMRHAAQLGKLAQIESHLARLDNIFVETQQGEALRVMVVSQAMSKAEAAAIEEQYRADLVRDFRLHDFRGIIQIKKDVRLPLADIYQELALLQLNSADEQQQEQARLLALREKDRVALEERRLQQRVSGALAEAQRLLILGEPGAGKTISLRFITLLLAHGFGAARLGLETPLIPVLVRLADYARELASQPTLSLANYLIATVPQTYDTDPRLGEFLRLALRAGACMVLLDGLDEVGSSPVQGLALRTQVVQQVQTFGDRWCSGDRHNRLVVTSRLEGYWSEPLRGFSHVQLSPLQPPDEVAAFLQRWFTAHEQSHDEQLTAVAAEARAKVKVDRLLPNVINWPSVRRLATNPLLLTILALIHETGGKLPQQRIELYEACALTLVESWRQAQKGLSDALLSELGGKQIIRIMAPLAYWLHETYPGGTAEFGEWEQQLRRILAETGFADEAAELTNRFLAYARHEAGLLAERGLGQVGFFHLTFEEYLAARELARQKPEQRKRMVRAHWEDPRWHEVILLAAGQLGIAEGRDEEASDFLDDLLRMVPSSVDNEGRSVILAGQALLDIGGRSVNRITRRNVETELRYLMQDVEPETERPRWPPRLPPRTRYEAGEVLDSLGWLPPDLHQWRRCQAAGFDGWAMTYPVTNAQYGLFVAAGGYENPVYWGGEESAAWRWRGKQHPNYRGSEPVTAPEYWRDPRFGQQRQGYPVVGVSWYEVRAYSAWLTALLQRLQAGDEAVSRQEQALVAALREQQVELIRLPQAGEWQALAGGTELEKRYPWDKEIVTKTEAEVVARANVSEAKLNGTSPVAMYPLGRSQPHGLLDMGGNVWEWTLTQYENVEDGRVLRGGSWSRNRRFALVSARSGLSVGYSDRNIGFRLVAPICSGS